MAGSQLDVQVLARANWSAVPTTLPVLALAFVYHNVLPLVVHKLECDAAKVREISDTCSTWLRQLVSTAVQSSTVRTSLIAGETFTAVWDNAAA